MPLPDIYRATIADQQRALAKIVQTAGVAPLKKVYDEALADIQAKLQRIAKGSFDETNLRGMLGQIRMGLAGLVREMSGQLGDAAFRVGIDSARRTLEDVAKLEQHFSGAYRPLPVRELARLSGNIQGQTSSLLRYHTASMLRYGSHMVGTFERELRTALVTGDTGVEAIERVAAAGEMEWWRGERIVRTELAYSSNASIKAANEAQAKELDGEMWSRWSEHVSDEGSPLDDRVGEDSEAMHGQVAPPGGMFTQPPLTPKGEEVSKTLVGDEWAHPPNRPNDRAVLTPWRAHWGVPGWIWQGGRVPVTQELFEKMSGSTRTPEVRKEPEVVPPPQEPPEPKKNPRRQAAARKAAAASVERRSEIHSAARSNLPQELHVVWDQEGHKFTREEAARIRGIKDRVNAASKLSQAFMEKYGSGAETMMGNEGDRYFRRTELDAKHAVSWADEQERKHFEKMEEDARAAGEIDEHGELTALGRQRQGLEPIPAPTSDADDDDPPF